MFTEDKDNSRVQIAEEEIEDESNVYLTESQIDDAIAILSDPIALSLKVKEQYEMV